MHPRVTLVGLAGGMLAGALFRPWFFEVFPAGYLSSWPDAQAGLAGALAVVGGLVLLLSGVMAARTGGLPGRANGAAAGALAGFLGGALVYALVGGAAAGVYATRSLFAHGLQPAASSADYLTLIGEGSLQNIVFGHAGFWAFSLAGALLGALGGGLAGGLAAEGWLAAWPGLALGGSLAAGLGVIVSTAMMSLMPAQLENTVTQTGRALSLPIQWAIEFPLATHLALLALFQAIGWLSLRALARRGLPGTTSLHLTGVFFVAMPLLVAGLLWLLAQPVFALGVFWVGLALNLVLGGLALRAAFRLQPRQPDQARSVADYTWQGLSGAVWLALVASASLSSFINVVMLMVPLIVPLTPLEDRLTEMPSTVDSLVSLVESNYIVQANLAMQWLAILLIVLGGLGWGIGRMSQRVDRLPRPKTPPA